MTFRLAGSLPKLLVEQWRLDKQRAEAMAAGLRDPKERRRRETAIQREWFRRMDACLDTADGGALWLKDARVARLVAASLHSLSGRKYTLEAFCIMANHVHAVFTPVPVAQASGLRGNQEGCPTYHSLSAIVHSLKSFTAGRANGLLGRSGQFWEHESYDHFVRDENELGRIIRYVLNNPVKAGLAMRWQDWPWSYSRYGAAEQGGLATRPTAHGGHARGQATALP